MLEHRDMVRAPLRTSEVVNPSLEVVRAQHAVYSFLGPHVVGRSNLLQAYVIMRSVVQSDQLQKAWGPRPWPINHITALRAETKQFVDQCDTEDMKDHAGLIQATEMLEELAWILLNCVGEHELSQWFQTKQNTFTDCRELQELGSKICDEAQVLKEVIFKAQGLTEIHPATAEVDSACLFCLWAFQRIGRGLSFRKDSLRMSAIFGLSNTLSANGLAECSRRWRVLLRLSASN